MFFGWVSGWLSDGLVEKVGGKIFFGEFCWQNANKSHKYINKTGIFLEVHDDCIMND